MAGIRPSHVWYFSVLIHSGCVESHDVHSYPIETRTVPFLASSAHELRTKANTEDRHARMKNALVQHIHQATIAKRVHSEPKVTDAGKNKL